MGQGLSLVPVELEVPVAICMRMLSRQTHSRGWESRAGGVSSSLCLKEWDHKVTQEHSYGMEAQGLYSGALWDKRSTHGEYSGGYWEAMVRDRRKVNSAGALGSHTKETSVWGGCDTDHWLWQCGLELARPAQLKLDTTPADCLLRKGLWREADYLAVLFCFLQSLTSFNTAHEAASSQYPRLLVCWLWRETWAFVVSVNRCSFLSLLFHSERR